MAIIAIFGGLFGLMSRLAGSPLVAFSIGFFVWIPRRQRGLKDAIREAATKMKLQAAASGFGT